ncbi:hypothetical protein K3495_g3128, partial [Podosphaera aphanis]
MSPATTRATSVKNSSESQALPEASLSEILAELKNISLQQSTLSERMDKLESVVNSSKITPTESFSDSQIKEIKETKGKEKAEPSKSDFNLDNDIKRGPLSIPGLQSTWNPARGPFRPPKRSPGPRNETNLLCLSDPTLDREDRKTWPLYNSN